MFMFLQNGLEEFNEKAPDKYDQSLWPSFGRICLGAAGILALGALLTQFEFVRDLEI
jgi:hypothetical protein